MKQNKLLALLSLSVMTTPLLADRISDSSRLEATSKTTQEFVQRGNTEIKSNKTIGSTTNNNLKSEIENNYSGLFNKDVYS